MSNRDLEPMTVVLPSELREYVRRSAEAEDRSLSSVIRRCVAAAAARQSTQEAR